MVVLHAVPFGKSSPSFNVQKKTFAVQEMPLKQVTNYKKMYIANKSAVNQC